MTKRKNAGRVERKGREERGGGGGGEEEGVVASRLGLLVGGATYCTGLKPQQAVTSLEGERQHWRARVC